MAMNFQRYTASGRVSVGDVKRRANNAWTNVQNVYARENGVWVKVWQREPEYPDISSLSSLGFTKVDGGGTIALSSGQNMTLKIIDSEYVGAIQSSHRIVLESRSFRIPGATTLSFTYYMSGKYHSPYIYLDLNYPPMSIQSAYTSNIATVNWDLTSATNTYVTLTFKMTETGNQTTPEHETYVFLSNLTVDGKAMNWR